MSSAAAIPRLARRLVPCIGLAAAIAPAGARADTAAAVRAEIQSALPPELDAVEVRLTGSLAGAEARAGTPVEVDWRRPARPGWITLRVRIGRRSGWVRAKVARVAAAVVAARDLPAGHVIGEADVRIEMRPLAAGSPVVGGLEGAVGRALRRPVNAGAPIAPDRLERAAPLPRGHRVIARVRRGRLSVSAAGVLERPAPIGQATSVRLRGSGQVVHGRLVDPHTVLIEVSP